ncbi:hypothetical protein LNP26_27145 [Klebsiella variicola subsp. variicola]|nr:hypothetical protein [Klebsiella variicola subsp. variicola]
MLLLQSRLERGEDIRSMMKLLLKTWRIKQQGSRSAQLALFYSFDDSYQSEFPTHALVDYSHYMAEHWVADKKLDKT